MSYFVELHDKRNENLFSEMKKVGLDVQVYESNKKMFKKDVIVFSPTKKIDLEICDNFVDGIIVFSGKISEEVKEVFRKKNIKYYNFLKYENFAIKNANLTAQGVLAIILSNIDVYFKNLNVLILGIGRISKALSILLSKLGIDFSLQTFVESEANEGLLFSDKVFLENEFMSNVSNYNVIVNTIPSKFFDGNMLCEIGKNTLFVDVASVSCLKEDCKVDFDFKHVLGIPQKFCPLSASKIMLEIILEELNND